MSNPTTKTVGAIHRATFKYIGTEFNTINLVTGKVYCIIETTTKDWWLAANEKGQVGYVPGAYLPEHLGRNAIVTRRFLERAIQVVFGELSSRPTAENRALMHKLKGLLTSLDSWENTSSMSETDIAEVESQLNRQPSRAQSLPMKKSKAPPPPSRTESIIKSEISVIRTKKAPAPAPPTTQTSESDQTLSEVSSMEDTTDQSTEREVQTVSEVRQLREKSMVSIQSQPDISATLDQVDIPENLGTGLVRLVKTESGLSSEKSRGLLRSVLCHLGSSIPELDRLMDKVMAEFLTDVKFARDEEDEKDLAEMFDQLEVLKDDMQQITNPIQDDLDKIIYLCKNCVKKLQDAHPDTILAVVEADNFGPLMILVNYYAIEPRWKIRHSVLTILQYLLGVSDTIARQLTPTVFPVELARDIRDETQKPKDQEYLLVLLDTFSQLLTVQEPLTVFTLENLTEEWLESVLLFIEDNDVQKLEKTNLAIMKLILSFNLHFDDLPEHNTVLAALGKRGAWTNLSELIMLTMNRGHDPLKNSEYDQLSSYKSNKSPHSLLKMMKDLFSSKLTADFFYTTDQNILIEIILRNLLDLRSDDPVRTEFLRILRAMIKFSRWAEQRHKAGQLKSTLTLFSTDDFPTDKNSVSAQNMMISKSILDDFNHLFP